MNIKEFHGQRYSKIKDCMITATNANILETRGKGRRLGASEWMLTVKEEYSV